MLDDLFLRQLALAWRYCLGSKASGRVTSSVDQKKRRRACSQPGTFQEVAGSD
jgi:hypothetical protein